MAETQTYDLIVVGSGGGGMAAALVAASAGARVVIVEKSDKLGGSTAMSGGIFWMPNSQAAERAGQRDSFDEGMRYLEATVGDVGPASSIARRTAFLREGRELLGFLEREGLTMAWCDGYSDYYDDRPGGKPRGRGVRAEGLWSGELGDWYPKLRQFEGWQIPGHIDEFSSLSLAKRTWKGRWTGLKLAARMMQEKFKRQQLLCRGGAMQGRMLQLLARHQVPIWTNVDVQDFVLDADRIRGVRVRHEGRDLELRGAGGVLLNVGGFARNDEMRQQYQPQPSSSKWTVANPGGETGEMILKAMALGAATDMLDEAVWIMLSFQPDGTMGGFHNPADMAKPSCIMVNTHGQRFCNEAAAYMEVGHAMHRTGSAPAWAILDSNNRSAYPWGMAPPGLTPAAWLTSGYMRKADTLAELAQKCGIDGTALGQTVARFNGFAQKGVDEDFHRGARQYDRYYADPTHQPNASLGPLNKAPFYAVQIVPGDVGTFGGLLCDGVGAVLRPDGSRIEGLYATGNCTASVMGRSYPGPGASVAATYVFGYTAAKHALDIATRAAVSRSAA